MSYQVLARKWRPGTFSELVGQEHVQRALINALDNDRIHHAFLFTGTRGVGKTTIARIFAKSLNCETGVTSKPCGQCPTCIEIAEGRFVDLIEVDAASRTKVEDTRELLENVQYAPTRGRYKVYLIDEVHMLSTHSFNALLKTLEEPPPHVKFLLATTDPKKLPVTILSRCLQFNLKRLPSEDIRQYLGRVLEQENIQSETAGLAQIARAADGSMRDALSLLDQAIAFGGGTVLNGDVKSMLGSVDSSHVYELLRLISNGDGNQLMLKAAGMAETSPNYLTILGDLLTLLQQIALKQMAPEVEPDVEDPEALRDLAHIISVEDIQLYYQIALIGRRDLPIAPDARSAFEMILLRMLAFKPQTEQNIPNNSKQAQNHKAAINKKPSPTATTSESESSTKGKEPSARGYKEPSARGYKEPSARGYKEPSARGYKEPSAPAYKEPSTHNATQTPQSQEEPPPWGDPSAQAYKQPSAQRNELPSGPNTKIPDRSTPAAPMVLEGKEIRWEQLVSRLEIGGLVQQLAMHCAVVEEQEHGIKLQLAENHRHLLSAMRLEHLQNAIQLQKPDFIISIEICQQTGNTPAMIQQRRAEEKQHKAETEIYNDATVKAIVDAFDAQTDSIKPN